MTGNKQQESKAAAADFEFDGEGEDDQPPSLGKRSGNKQPSGHKETKTSSKKPKTDNASLSAARKKTATSRAPELGTLDLDVEDPNKR